MIPVNCRVKHDPPNSYGDCIRACVASLMDMDAEQVPHFAHDDCDGETINGRIRDWLQSFGFAPFWAHYTGDVTRDEILAVIGEQNPGVHFALYGATEHGEHIVICCNGRVVHDPAWVRSPIVRPGEHGLWTVLLIVRL